MDPDGGFPDILVTGVHMSHDLGFHLLCQLGSIVDNSFYHVNHLHVPGTAAIQETFSCIFKLAGALLFRLSAGSILKSPRCSNISKLRSRQQFKHSTHCGENLKPLRHNHASRIDCSGHHIFSNIAFSAVRRLWKEVGQLQSLSVLSLATVLVPPFDRISPELFALPLVSSIHEINKFMNQTEDGCQGCPSISLSSICWLTDTVEPKTGIKFPSFLCNSLGKDNNLHHITEILVGTGCKLMRIVRVKSVKLYAFGIYVHLDSVCEKLGPKYASVPVNELKDRPDFLEDLLRKDIHMTLRLVVSCNGVKINAVKEFFERSLQARLQKMDPDPDYHGLSVFGSYFNQDIPLPMGTTIDFRKTADGQLITEISGRHIGAVRSKDLCRAFFDMYIGEGPVSIEAKHDLAQTMAGLISRC